MHSPPLLPQHPHPAPPPPPPPQFTGYSLVWVLWWSTVLGLALQEMAARLGVVAGEDLARVARRIYPRPISRALYAMMELAIIGSDIQEVMGTAIALKLLFGFDLWVGCLVTGLDTFTFLLIHRMGVRWLESFVVSSAGRRGVGRVSAKLTVAPTAQCAVAALTPPPPPPSARSS